MIHRPFLRSAIQVVSDFRIGDFDLQSVCLQLGLIVFEVKVSLL